MHAFRLSFLCLAPVPQQRRLLSPFHQCSGSKLLPMGKLLSHSTGHSGGPQASGEKDNHLQALGWVRWVSNLSAMASPYDEPRAAHP